MVTAMIKANKDMFTKARKSIEAVQVNCASCQNNKCRKRKYRIGLRNPVCWGFMTKEDGNEQINTYR